MHQHLLDFPNFARIPSSRWVRRTCAQKNRALLPSHLSLKGVSVVRHCIIVFVLWWRTEVSHQDMRKNPPHWVQCWSLQRNVKTEKSASSAIWRRLSSWSSTRHRKRRAPKMQRHRRISSFWPRRCRLAGTSPVYSAVFMRARRPARMPRKRKGPVGWRCCEPWLSTPPTPNMGRILGEMPGTLQLLGAGRRASAQCSRVSCGTTILELAGAQSPTLAILASWIMLLVTFWPDNQSLVRGMRCEEHIPRIAFMEKVARVEQSSKFTGTQVYSIFQKETLANTLPGKPTKQAPRIMIGMLSMHEDGYVQDVFSLPPLSCVVDSRSNRGEH